MGHRALIRLLTAGDGTTAVEYAVLVSLMLLFCIGGINVLGQSIARPVQEAAEQIQAAHEGGVTVKKTRGSSRTLKTVRSASGRE